MPAIVSLLIKMFLPQLIGFFIDLFINVMHGLVQNTDSKIDDEILTKISNEKEEIKTLAMKAASDTGIYKKLKTLSK